MQAGGHRWARLAVVVALMAALVAASGVAYLVTAGSGISRSEPAPDALAPSRSFFEAWGRADYRAMYALLTPAARRATPYRRFAAAYRHAAAAATVESIRLSGPVTVAGGVGHAAVAVRTRLFGTLHEPFALPLALAGNSYRVDWTSAQLFPGLAAGEHLQRVVRQPGARGAILASDRSVLANGPADARVYPQGAPFALLTGFVRAPQTAAERDRRLAQGWPADQPYGQGGLEASLDQVLAGAPRTDLVAIGAAGRHLIARRQGRRPHDVVTTLSPGLQQVATTALDGKEGGIVVLDATSGAVRASAGLGMDGRQPPGSTFKTITAAAALTKGTATPASTYEYAHYAQIGGVRLRNFHGELCGGSLVQAFALSCNSVFSPLAIATGAESMARMAGLFGFNHVSSIAYPVPESVAPRATLLNSDLELATMGIGQGGVAATPLQMAMAAQVMAAGGVLRSPWLLRRPKLHTDRVAPRRVVSSRVAGEIADMMRAVVSYGTGVLAQSAIAVVNGKTGTAELGKGVKDDAWFIGYAPAEAPRVVVAVLIVHGGVGGKVAAPIARQMIDAALQQ